MAPAAGEQMLAGRYRVVERLGSGGMAVVFLAEDERLGRRVAVKRLHSDSTADTAARFQREAKLLAQLNHPNLVAVYDAHVDEDELLIVMEYVPGETLREALGRGPLEPERAVAVIEGVAAALDHAHARGIVHRDVKPANVLLGEDGAVKLADLGVAGAAERTQITLTGTALGTPAYMAPEQLEGRTVGPAADVYALGAIAFEALTGHRARPGRTPMEIAHRAATEPPPDLRDALPGAPAEAAEILRVAMDRDFSRRPVTAGELAQRLAVAVRTTGADRPMAGGVGRETRRSPEFSGPPPAPDQDATLSRGGRRTTAGWLRWFPIAATAALVVALIALLAGGGDDEPDRAASPDRGQTQAETDEAAPRTAPEEQEQRQEQSQGQGQGQGGGDAARGRELNDQGFALMNDGRYDEAVEVLRQAVNAFPEDTSDINYAYALFNLGKALRLAGRPEEAIPILERRLQIPNQTDEVQAELDAARADLDGRGDDGG